MVSNITKTKKLADAIADASRSPPDFTFGVDVTIVVLLKYNILK